MEEKQFAHLSDDDLVAELNRRKGSASMFAKLSSESRLSMRLAPAAGQMLQAKTLGGTLTEFANLLEALGEPYGLKSEVLVESVQTDSDGGITITVLALRVEKGIGA